MDGPDSEFSMEPDEFKAMVDSIRNVEKALGSSNFELTEKMIINQDFSRSLFLLKILKKVNLSLKIMFVQLDQVLVFIQNI